MANIIQSVAMNERDIIVSRSLDSGKNIKSVNINQITGDFVVTIPYENKIIIYPQSPNNPTSSLLGAIKTISSFSGYGYLNYPMDARFDYSRGKMWIADSGNSRVLKIDSFSLLADFSIGNISLPHSIIPNVNNGGVFIKGFTNSTTGVIYYYSVSGVLQFLFTYPNAITGNFTASEASLPLPSTMAFDHTRSRLWWISEEIVYMADISNNQVTEFDLSLYNYLSTIGLDVDVMSGNAFICCLSDSGRSYIVQIFRDNNVLISSAFLPKQGV